MENGKTFSSGGRILGVTAMGNTLAEAQKLAYKAVAELKMPNMHYRNDIGNKGLAKK